MILFLLLICNTYSSQEAYGPLESIFQICKGATSLVDLSRYETPSKSYLGFLTFSYGIIADVDIESECLHFLGAVRNDIWAVWRILIMRKYACRFSYLNTLPSPDSMGEGALSRMSDTDAHVPLLSEEVPSSWNSIEGDFICFWACQVSHAAYNLHNSPGSALNDGLFRVLLIR